MFGGTALPPVEVCSPAKLLGCFASAVPTEAYADAAHRGHLQCLRFLHECGYEWHKRTCVYAAASGHLPCLQYAHEQGCPWEQTCAGAARTGQLGCLKYAHEQGCWWDELTCELAAATGHLACLAYAHENGCIWDAETICEYAVRGQHLECLQYCYEHGGKLRLSSKNITGSERTTTGQSRVRLPVMNMASAVRAQELYVSVFVASAFKHVSQTLAAEAIQSAWRKRFYRPDSLFCQRLKQDFDLKKQQKFS